MGKFLSLVLPPVHKGAQYKHRLFLLLVRFKCKLAPLENVSDLFSDIFKNVILFVSHITFFFALVNALFLAFIESVIFSQGCVGKQGNIHLSVLGKKGYRHWVCSRRPWYYVDVKASNID